MPFKINDSRINRDGRPKGSKNKTQKELRETIKEILEIEFEKISELFANLEPEKRINLLIKLIPYVLPKLESESKKNEIVLEQITGIEISNSEIKRISKVLEEEL